MRRAARTDANLEQIVAAFRKLGCSVNVRNDDMADLDVGFGGVSIIVEVKDGSKPPSARKLTPGQIKRRATWTGGIRLVENLEHVREAVDTLRRWHRRLAS